MFQPGHVGLTAGITSAACAYWFRQRVKRNLAALDADDDELVTDGGASAPDTHEQTLGERVRQRSPDLLAAAVFCAAASAVSASVDGVERILGVEHRTVGHSLPVIGGLYAAANFAHDHGMRLVREVADTYGYTRTLDPIFDALDDLINWVRNGSVAGALTHLLGDLPTKGNGGFAALKSLWPFSRRSVNLKLVLSGNPLFNKVGVIGGGLLAGAAWVSMGAHLVAPRLPEQTLYSLVKTLARVGKRIIMSVGRAIPELIKEATDRVTDACNRITAVIRDAFATAGRSIRSFGARIRVGLTDLIGPSRSDRYPMGTPTPTSTARTGDGRAVLG